jgi:hypothetical protein
VSLLSVPNPNPHGRAPLSEKLIQQIAHQLEQRYRNSLPTARQWLKKAHPEIVLERGFGGRHTLATYAQINLSMNDYKIDLVDIPL